MNRVHIRSWGGKYPVGEFPEVISQISGSATADLKNLGLKVTHSGPKSIWAQFKYRVRYESVLEREDEADIAHNIDHFFVPRLIGHAHRVWVFGHSGGSLGSLGLPGQKILRVFTGPVLTPGAEGQDGLHHVGLQSPAFPN